ncbi:MAG: rod shape-determining protein MreD [Bacteroidaceae bacterium]|nr:rod shape-determining protein MreD [Bacteroidaceae bacterium]
MVGTFLKRFILMTVLLALQVLVFNHVEVMNYATPMVCVYFILLFPIGTSHWQILLWAFAMGLLQDIFSNTPGMNAASLTLIGFLQPWILKTFSRKDHDDNDEALALPPSARTMKWAPFIRYVLTAVVLQQVCFYVLEAFSFFNLQEMGINIGGGTLMSVLIIVAIEGVRNSGAKKQRG